MSDVVLLEVSERIATITINRPEARNALNNEVRSLLPTLLREADGRDDVDVLDPHRRRPGVLRRPRPQGARLRRQPPRRRPATGWAAAAAPVAGRSPGGPSR